jgi:spermidine synthase
LMIDLYDHDAAAPVLDSEAFYRHCRALLTDDGALTINLFGRESSYERTLAKLKRVFPGAGRLWAFRPTKEGNTVVLALSRAQVPLRATLSDRAEKIESAWKLPAPKWLRNIRSVEPV